MADIYFKSDDLFEDIIRDRLSDKKIISIDRIVTGWTNYVFDVTCSNSSYIFRFPRDEFWSRALIKEYEFSNYVSNKIDFKISKLNIYYDKGRPYSVHEKLKGVVLSKKMDDLTDDEFVLVCSDIAKFMYQLHGIDYVSNKIFDINNINLDLASFVKEFLVYHINNNISFEDIDLSSNLDNILVHGDLNSDNILLDDNNRVIGVIDFSFGGYGDKYDDIARIIGRTSPRFKNQIIKCYEDCSKENLDLDFLNKKIITWKNIDNSYINYMKKAGIFK